MKRCSKVSKIFKHLKNRPFSCKVIGLQTKTSNFNKIRLKEKCFLREKCSEIVGGFLGKEYSEVFGRVALLKISRISLFFGNASLHSTGCNLRKGIFSCFILIVFVKFIIKHVKLIDNCESFLKINANQNICF